MTRVPLVEMKGCGGSFPESDDAKGGKWLPIAEAERRAGTEILGTRWADGICIREPFVSFWSPTLGKFYCDPTHFIRMPQPPVQS